MAEDRASATAGTLSESLEDYLEAIYHIVSAKQAARASDISARLGVNRSSVTGALRALAERELVNYAPYDIVTLTAEGERAAGDIVHRHEVLRDFFVGVLAVDDGLADSAACGMEHHVGKVVLRRLGFLAEFLASSPPAGDDDWAGGFREFCRRREAPAAAGAEPGKAGK